MKTIYLAGAISGLSYVEATEWRLKFALDLLPGWQALDPMKGVVELLDKDNISLSYPGLVLLTDSMITDTDLWHIRNCDAVVVNFLNAPSSSRMIGTLFEVGYAIAQNKLVYSVAEPGSPFSIHPFLKRTCIQFDFLENVHKAMERL